MWSNTLCACATITLISAVSCANILFVVPTVSKSHYVVFDALISGLLERGHRITAITTFPRKIMIENLTEIDVLPVRKIVLNEMPLSNIKQVPEGFFHTIERFFDNIKSNEQVLDVKEVQNIINSNLTFDLVIYEMFADDVFLGFPSKFKAPAIAMGSCYMFPWVPERFGIPAGPSYFPGFYSGYSTNMDFLQRLRNTFLDISGKVFYKFFLEPETTKVTTRYFGTDTPPTHDLEKNISLYFTNTHLSYFGAHAYPPQVVDVSGIHLKPEKLLHQDLDKWMNDSTQGVIYFSFGSMLRGATLPTEKVQAFIKVFGKLPQKVLWKWEDDALENLPKNIKIMKWLPQRDVLAHPKVRVFISHGGLLGTTEAVVSGVPVLGIPMYGDQANNVAALVDKGVAIHVDYNNISVASLSYALNALLNDNSYRDNAKLLSRRFLDRPLSPLDTAVYWTEYVIRHRGAPHLQSAAVHLTWYQYYLLDVAAVCFAALTALLALVYYIIKLILTLLGITRSTKLKTS